MASARRRLTLLGTVMMVVGLAAAGGAVAAQDPGTDAVCVPDTEPNDTPEAAPALSAPGCITGTLPDDDQDLLIWTITEEQAAQPWDITLDGVEATITGTKLFAISSAPGEVPLVVGNQLLEVAQGVDALGPAVATNILLPAGRYLVGTSRSATANDQPPVEIDYQVTIAAAAPLPPVAEVEPNDDATSATVIEGAFALSGDLRDSQDDYRWTTPELGEGQAWDLRLQGPLTSGAQVTLLDAAGSILASAYPNALGVSELADLRLPPGEHILNIYPSSSVSTPYSLVATLGELAGADPEPNSAVAAAVAIDAARPVVRGRLAAADNQDWYSLVVDDALAASLADIRLIWREGPSRRLCLNDADGNALQCRSGDRGVSLSGLRLAPGTVTLSVSGDPSASSPYLLRVDSTTAPAADFEAEPNDDTRTASIVVDQAIRAQFGPQDYDFFRVTTTGEPQLWQVDVTGTGIGSLRWVKADGTELGSGELTAGHAFLTDLYLIPGNHWLRVDGSNGEYSLTLTPLGPPDPDGEREPNNQAIDAEPFDVGKTRTGRLPIIADADVFRFTVDTPDHLRITVTPPDDATIRMRIEGGSLRLGDIDGQQGVPTVYDAVLQPGDYEIWLSTPGEPSDDRYTLGVERLDPFLVADDREPNDTLHTAGALPRSLHVDGLAPVDGELDWYALGSLPVGGDLTIHSEGLVDSVLVSDGLTEYVAAFDDGITWVLPALPSGVPLWLRVSARGPYGFDVDPGTTGLPAATADAGAAPVDVSLTLDDASVAAYWAAGQRLTGAVHLVSTGAAAQDLTLDWAASDADWSVELERSQVTLPAGGSMDIPVTVRVLPDARVDDAVRLTVRATNASGDVATGWVEEAADPDQAPIAPYQAWHVPDELLGGLNVASAAIGGSPVVSIDPAAEAELYDGVTPSGRGFVGSMAGPLALTVDLAGDAPAPIAGMILNPLGRRTSIDPVPRAISLSLSDDGATWQEVFRGELSPRSTEQAFVLPEPVPARYAQLRIDSTWGGTTGEVVLGEWMVVAEPGAVPDSMPANIAEPARGGHVVWMAPAASAQEYADSILTDDPTETATTLGAREGDSLSTAIGFQDDRQALLMGMEWVDPVPSDPGIRNRSVNVAISTTSPVGPWQDVGTWKLDRADDGTVVPFRFEDPTWARFVRLTGTRVRKDTYSIELPATVRVLEMPTSDTYRSILGEWGPDEPRGPRDWLEPADLTVIADEDDGDDSPETARTLVPGTTAAGRAHRDADVDWYRVSVPQGQNSLRISVGGVPAVGVSLTLFDAAGNTVPMTFEVGEAGDALYQANVEAGASYRVRVEQPPFSAVFGFDTSGSMGNYLPFVTQALRAYTGGVSKGEEAVKVQPFDEDPLLDDWSDDPYLLQDAVDRYVIGGSSSAETALIDASGELAGREGARAVLLVTDAETSSYARSVEMWAALASVRPMVFAVHVGSDGEPVVSRHFMQDWAATGGGFYQYALSHGEMDQAFERMATWLRRPAAYTLDLTTSEEEVPPPTPGDLSVVAVDELGAPVQAPASKDVAVEIILDTSGSMLDKFGGRSRIDSARQVLEDLVTEQLPPGAPVAVRVLGSRSDICGTRLLAPLGPLDPEAIIELVGRVKVDRAADTAIGAALDSVQDDLAQATGTRIVLLISDSKEVWPHRDLCGRDPQDAIRDLQKAGIDARINIVGMAVEDRAARRQMAKWAKLGGGAYFDARDRKQLDEAIRAAVSAPYQVFDQAGELVGNGTVGGAAVKLPPGTYKVVVLNEPPVTYEGIVIVSDESVTVTLPVVRDETELIRTPRGSPGPDAADPAASPGP